MVDCNFAESSVSLSKSHDKKVGEKHRVAAFQSSMRETFSKGAIGRTTQLERTQKFQDSD